MRCGEDDEGADFRGAVALDREVARPDVPPVNVHEPAHLAAAAAARRRLEGEAGAAGIADVEV